MPAMDETEYTARLGDHTRADLLRLCRMGGITAHKLQSNAALIHVLWVLVGLPARDRYVARVNAALSKLGCVPKDATEG